MSTKRGALNSQLAVTYFFLSEYLKMEKCHFFLTVLSKSSLPSAWSCVRRVLIHRHRGNQNRAELKEKKKRTQH